MFDASKHIPGGWHPFSRSVVSPTPGAPRESLVLPYSLFPVNYYYIDFGLSIQFPSKFQRQRVVGTAAMNRTVPELSNTVPYDPFATDIRMFGDLLKQFQEVRSVATAHWHIRPLIFLARCISAWSSSTL